MQDAAQNTAALIVAARDKAILDWQEAAKVLAVAKDNENTLRLAMVKLCFGTNIKEGTNTLELGGGYKLKVVQPYNYNLDKTDDCKKTDAALTAIEEMGNEGSFIAERLVKWEPKLSVTEYRTLDAKYKVHIDRVLTFGPGSPQCELIVPKSKG